MRSMPATFGSRQNARDRIALREEERPALLVVSFGVRIDAQAVIDRGREVGGRGRRFERVGGDLVGLAVDLAAAECRRRRTAPSSTSGQCSRPPLLRVIFGDRPNSAATTTSVSSSWPVFSRSVIRASKARSNGGTRSSLWAVKLFQCVSQAKPFWPCVRCQLHCTSRARRRADASPQQHRLAEQIAAVALALRPARSLARSTALRTASDEITSSACAWFVADGLADRPASFKSGVWLLS